MLRAFKLWSLSRALPLAREKKNRIAINVRQGRGRRRNENIDYLLAFERQEDSVLLIYRVCYVEISYTGNFLRLSKALFGEMPEDWFVAEIH